MSAYEDTLMEVYLEVKKMGIQKEFEEKCKEMDSQNKHRFKTVGEKWEYALQKIKAKT